MKQNPTINDIAKVVKLSRTTVSNILNNKGVHSSATRRRVLDLVKSMNYERNSLAVSMKTGKSMTLGVILSDIMNPMYLPLIRGIEKISAQYAYTVLLSDSGDDIKQEQRYIKSFGGRQIDGLIISVCDETAPHFELLNQHFPVVFINCQPQHLSGDVVLADNQFAVYDAMHYLMSLQHKKIGIIGCTLQYITGRDRYDAYVDALQNSGIPVNGDFVSTTRLHDYDDAHHVALDYLRRNHPQITALLCVGIRSCVGVMRAANELGINIPNDLSIVGFYDSVWCDLLNPRITMVDLPGLEIGMQAAATLISRIEERTDEEFKVIPLPPKLIIRDSCKEVIEEKQGWRVDV